MPKWQIEMEVSVDINVRDIFSFSKNLNAWFSESNLKWRQCFSYKDAIRPTWLTFLLCHWCSRCWTISTDLAQVKPLFIGSLICVGNTWISWWCRYLKSSKKKKKIRYKLWRRLQNFFIIDTHFLPAFKIAASLHYRASIEQPHS